MEMFAKRLKQERLRLGLTQSAFARIGGVEVNAQGHYESGTRCPKVDYLKKVCMAGVDVTYLLNQHVPDAYEGTTRDHLGQARRPNPSGAFDPDDGPNRVVREVFVQLGQNLQATASAIAEIAKMANPRADSADDRMLHHQLQVLQLESKKLLDVALDKAEHHTTHPAAMT